MANLETGAKIAEATIEPISQDILLPASISHTFPKGQTLHNSEPYNPDAAFIVRTRSGQVIYCTLEVDAGTETLEPDEPKTPSLTKATYLKKFLQIKSVFDTKSFKEIGFTHMRALHVTNSETRRNNMMRLAEKVFEGPSQNNLFQVHAKLGDYRIDGMGEFVAIEPDYSGYLFGAWKRPGHPDFDFKK
jgi:hypothetical protein